MLTYRNLDNLRIKSHKSNEKRKMTNYTKLIEKWLTTLRLRSGSLEGIEIHHSESGLVITNRDSA